MDPTAELAGLVRRLPTAAYDRVLLLLHCLITTSGTALSLQSLCQVALCACSGAAPRFLFALTNTDTLLRSPDGGWTWRLSFTRNNEGEYCPPVEAEDVVAELQRIATSAADAATDDARAVDSTASVVCAADGCGDVVALCGLHGCLAVSADRGVTFTAAAPSPMETAYAEADWRHVQVLDDHSLLLSDGHHIVAMEVQRAGYGKATLGTAHTVLRCTSPVSMLRVLTTAGGRLVVAVSEVGKLHLSLDGAVSFLEVRHCVGYVRDMDTIEVLRPCEMPSLPMEAVGTSLELPHAAPATKAASTYAYTCGYKYDCATAKANATALQAFEAAACSHGNGVAYLYFFITGCGTEVMPYDYSAVLCVCTRRLPSGEVVVLSSARDVCYIAFSESRRHAPLLCALVRPAGHRGFLACRGSSVGVSSSSDFVHWTTPHGAAPVGLVAAAGGTVTVCGRNRVFTTLGGVEERRSVPHDIRAPLLTSAFTM